MLAKSKMFPLSGAHTAGIFSDITVDGPEIGTLVVIVDRAKNLPNRKTIGKQDPYCAARLGKEANKTATDVRGGQTPKWDQELRFTVHDSPDYYQLKLSVFNDDKKTELIGEAWIELKTIITEGGGQCDLWQNLTCRGKYAGEIRIEITFYDTRSKPEKQSKTRELLPSDMNSAPVTMSSAPVSANNSTVSLPTSYSDSSVRRRPLPAGPAPPLGSSVSASSPHQTPPRKYNPTANYAAQTQSPLQPIEYNTPPSHHQQQQQRHHSDLYSKSPSAAAAAAAAASPHYSTSPSHRDMSHSRNNRYDTSPKQYDDRDFSPKHAPPATPPEPQSMRYSGAPHTEQYNSRSSREEPRFEHPRHDSFSNRDNFRYEYRRESLPTEDRPPPPPVHRTRHNSTSAHDILLRNSYEALGQRASQPMRHDVLKHEAHRQSMGSYNAPPAPSRPAMRGFESAPPVQDAAHYPRPEYHQNALHRPHSFDCTYDDAANRSMQPTVEDAPESPLVGVNPQSFNNNTNHNSPVGRTSYDEDVDRRSATPAPLNLSMRARHSHGPDSFAAPSPQASPNAAVDYNTNNNGTGRQWQAATTPSRDRDVSPSYEAPSPSNNEKSMVLARRMSTYGDLSPLVASNALPGVPISLIPGVDPALAREVSNHIYEERRNEDRYGSPQVSPTRSRQSSEAPRYEYSTSPQATAAPYTPSSAYERSPVRDVYNIPGGGGGGGASPSPAYSPHQSYNNSNYGRSVSPRPSQQHMRSHSRGVSPNPNDRQYVRRQSVSPAPPPLSDERFSSVPFGPDSYNTLNPSSKVSAEPDVDEKIITHDGREIDPSEHLPVESWAPEPEPKPDSAPPAPSRQVPGGAQPMPPSSGRRQLRIGGRPHSTSTPQSYVAPTPAGDMAGNSNNQVAHYTGGGRTRLQKRQNRASMIPTASPGMGSSPLAPIASHNYRDNDSFTPPRAIPRSSTWDYPNENSAPKYGGGSSPSGNFYDHEMRHESPQGPPPPAKIPLGYGTNGQDSGMDEWALVREIQNIDLGAGRSRRHRGY